MTFERQAGICLTHSLAVIDHLNAGLAGVHDDHFHTGGTGIDGILYQFFDDRCRTLYHLAGGYLVGHGIGKKTDNISHRRDGVLQDYCLPSVCTGALWRTCGFKSEPPRLGRHSKRSSLWSGRI